MHGEMGDGPERQCCGGLSGLMSKLFDMAHFGILIPLGDISCQQLYVGRPSLAEATT